MMPSEGGRAIDLFVSYAKKDAFDTASEVVVDLERRGLNCWVAPRDIPAGASWSGEIAKSIRRSQSFLLLLSECANASEEIEKEVNEAARQRKTLFVIRLADIEPSDGLGYHLNRVQWLDLFRNRESVFNEITARVMALRQVTAPLEPAVISVSPAATIAIAASSKSADAGSEDAAASTTPRHSRKSWTRALASLCAAVALIGAGWGLSFVMRDQGASKAVASAPATSVTSAAPAPSPPPASAPQPPVVQTAAARPAEPTIAEPRIGETKPLEQSANLSKPGVPAKVAEEKPITPEAKQADPPLSSKVVTPPAIDPPPALASARPTPETPAPAVTLPPVERPPVTLPSDLAQSLRSDMQRTACSSRPVENRWNAAEMSADVRRFAKALDDHPEIVQKLPPAQTELLRAMRRKGSLIEASLDLRDLLHAAPDKLCPPACSARETLKNGVCVAKPVASAEEPRPRPAPSPRRSEGKAAGGGGRHCFSAGGTSFCE